MGDFRTPMAVNHRISQSSSLGKLDGVYGLRQPGFAPHPVLKHRQQQRTELRRSASLVLSQNRSPAISAARDAERPLDPAEWSADVNPSTPLRPLKGVNWPSWMHPTFMNEVPPRLEDCRMKLAAVERELSRYSKAAGGSGFRAVKQQHELPAWVQDYEGLYGQQALGGKSFSLMESERPLSGSFGMGEPAPEPLAASWPSPEGAEGPEVQLEDGEVELDDEDLPGQLSQLQTELLQLDIKWQAVDDDRQSAKQQRDELESRLETCREQEHELTTRVADLGSQVKEAEAEKQTLCGSLSVSEEKAQELRRRLGTLELGEKTLQAQASGLLARLQTLQGEASEMQARLCRDGEAQQSTECHSSPINDLAIDQATSMELFEIEERKKVKAELEFMRSAAQKRQADLEKELAAATERHSLAEAELERVSLLAKESTDVPPTGTGQADEDTGGHSPLACDAGTPLANTSPGFPSESPAFEAEIPSKSIAAGTEKASVHSCQGAEGPSAAAIPELVFVTDLTPIDEQPTVQPGGMLSQEPSFPAKCQVHLATNELCLQALTPVGPLCSAPLASIVATRLENSTGTFVEIELEGFTEGPVRLATTDEHAASALVAALGIPDRVPPGFGIGLS